MPQAEYLLGHSEREIQRLIHQAAVLRPIMPQLIKARAMTEEIAMAAFKAKIAADVQASRFQVGPAQICAGIRL